MASPSVPIPTTIRVWSEEVKNPFFNYKQDLNSHIGASACGIVGLSTVAISLTLGLLASPETAEYIGSALGIGTLTTNLLSYSVESERYKRLKEDGNLPPQRGFIL